MSLEKLKIENLWIFHFFLLKIKLCLFPKLNHSSSLIFTIYYLPYYFDPNYSIVFLSHTDESLILGPGNFLSFTFIKSHLITALPARSDSYKASDVLSSRAALGKQRSC